VQIVWIESTMASTKKNIGRNEKAHASVRFLSRARV
jgi:hypothetical protein